MFSSFWLKNLE